MSSSSTNDNTSSSSSQNSSMSTSSSSPSTLAFELKAGMTGVDKEAVAKIIDDLTRGTPYYEYHKKKELEREKKAQKLLEKSVGYGKLSAEAHSELRSSVEAEVSLILKHAKIGRYCHIDMDAYYAQIEELDKPYLKHVPMAVGSHSIIGTSNYPARKFGLRGGMTGFVARHLCPQLIIVPPNFEKYQAMTQQIREVAKNFDKNFIAPFGGDEFIIELSDENIEAWKKRKRRDPNFTQKELLHAAKSSSSSSKTAGSDLTPDDNRTIDEFLLVQDLRQEIFNVTKLTCSAGIGPTRTLAKIVSNFNKPNGQFALEPRTIDEIREYVWANLSTRQIPGIGPATDTLLQKLGIRTCRELFETRNRLKFLMPPKTFSFLLQAGLGLTGTVSTDVIMAEMAANKINNNNNKAGSSKSKSSDKNSGNSNSQNNTNKTGGISSSPLENNDDKNNNNNKSLEYVTKQVGIERTLEKRVTSEREAEDVLTFLLNRAIGRLKETIEKHVQSEEVGPTITNNEENHLIVTIKNVGVRARLLSFDFKDGVRKISDKDVVDAQDEGEDQQLQLQLLQNKVTNDGNHIGNNVLIFDRSGSLATEGPAKKINDIMTKVLKEKVVELSNGSEKSTNSFLTGTECNQYRLMGCRLAFLWPPIVSDVFVMKNNATTVSENDNSNQEHNTNSSSSSSSEQQQQQQQQHQNLLDSSAALFDDDDELLHGLKSSEIAEISSAAEKTKKSSPEVAADKTRSKTLLVVQGPEMRSFAERGLEALPLEEKNSYEIFEFPIVPATASPTSTSTDNIFVTSVKELNDLIHNSNNNNNNNSNEELLASNGLARLIQKMGLRSKVEYTSSSSATAQEKLRDLNYKSILLCGSVSNKESASSFQGMIIGAISLLWPSLLELRERELDQDKARQQQFLEIVARKNALSTAAANGDVSLVNPSKSHPRSYVQVLDPYHQRDQQQQQQLSSAGEENEQQANQIEEEQEENGESETVAAKDEDSTLRGDELDFANPFSSSLSSSPLLNSNSLLIIPSPRECFLNMHQHVISFSSPLREADRASLKNAIHSLNERQRKQWLLASPIAKPNIDKEYSSTSPAGYILTRSYANFVNCDLKNAALGECQDVMPHCVDGFTRAQRQIVKTLLICEMNHMNSLPAPSDSSSIMLPTSQQSQEQNQQQQQSPLTFTIDEIVDLAIELNLESTASDLVLFTPQQLSKAAFELTELNSQANLPLLLLADHTETVNSFSASSSSSSSLFVANSSNISNPAPRSHHKKDISFVLSPVFRALFPREDDELIRAPAPLQSSSSSSSTMFVPSLLAPIVPLILINSRNNTTTTNTNETSSTSCFAGNFHSQLPRFHPLDVAARTATYLRYVLRRKGGQITDGGGGDKGEVSKAWYRGVDADPFIRSPAAIQVLTLQQQQQLVFEGSINATSSTHQHHHQKRSFAPPFICIDKSSKKVATLSEIDDFFRIHHRARNSYYKRRISLRSDRLEHEINMEENRYRFCSAIGRGTLKFGSVQGEDGLIDFLEKFGYERYVLQDDPLSTGGSKYRRLVDSSMAVAAASSSSSAKKRLRNNNAASGSGSFKRAQYNSNSHNDTNHSSISRSNNSRARGYEYILSIPPSSFTEQSLKESWLKIQRMKEIHRDLSNGSIDANSLFRTDLEVFTATVTNHLVDQRDKQRLQLAKAQEQQKFFASVVAADSANGKSFKHNSKNNSNINSKDKHRNPSESESKNAAVRRAEIAEKIRRENEHMFKLNNQIYYDSVMKKRYGGGGGGGGGDQGATSFSDLPDEEISFREQKRQFMRSMSKDDRRRVAARHDDEEYEYTDEGGGAADEEGEINSKRGEEIGGGNNNDRELDAVEWDETDKKSRKKIDQKNESFSSRSNNNDNKKSLSSSSSNRKNSSSVSSSSSSVSSGSLSGESKKRIFMMANNDVMTKEQQFQKQQQNQRDSFVMLMMMNSFAWLEMTLTNVALSTTFVANVAFNHHRNNGVRRNSLFERIQGQRHEQRRFLMLSSSIASSCWNWFVNVKRRRFLL